MRKGRAALAHDMRHVRRVRQQSRLRKKQTHLALRHVADMVRIALRHEKHAARRNHKARAVHHDLHDATQHNKRIVVVLARLRRLLAALGNDQHTRRHKVTDAKDLFIRKRLVERRARSDPRRRARNAHRHLRIRIRIHHTPIRIRVRLPRRRLFLIVVLILLHRRQSRHIVPRARRPPRLRIPRRLRTEAPHPRKRAFARRTRHTNHLLQHRRHHTRQRIARRLIRLAIQRSLTTPPVQRRNAMPLAPPKPLRILQLPRRRVQYALHDPLRRLLPARRPARPATQRRHRRILAWPSATPLDRHRRRLVLVNGIERFHRLTRRIRRRRVVPCRWRQLGRLAHR